MAIVVYDNFNGANGADLDSHAPDIDVVGSGWNKRAANEVELDGSGAVKFSSAGDGAWIDAGSVDQIVTANINAGGSDNRFQVVVRSDRQIGTIGTNYSLNMRQGVTGSDNIYLFKRVSGNSTLISSAQVDFSASSTNEFELSAIGNNIVAKVDGVEIFNVIDNSISTGSYAGFYHALYTNGSLRVYDFTVDDTVANTATSDIDFTVNAPTVSASASATLPQPSVDISYSISAPTVSVSATASLPQPVSDVSFTVNAPTVSANASATIPGYSASVSFSVNSPNASADASATLPNPSADIAYTVNVPSISATASASLPQPVSNIAFTVNTPTVAVSAEATQTGYNADIAFSVNAPSVSISASATLPQPSASVSFAVSPPQVSVVAIVGGIAIIVDSETNINQRVLSNNINAPILSNNING